MKVYYAKRTKRGVRCDVIEVSGTLAKGYKTSVRELPHVARNSPAGFEFGFSGSGPYDLALSILADHFEEVMEEIVAGRRRCFSLYEKFTDAFVARAQGQEFAITDQSIDRWLKTIGAAR